MATSPLLPGALSLLLVFVLQVIGVPALPAPPAVRRAVEAAWFEARPLRIVYKKANGIDSARTISIRNLVFDRQLTLLNCIDLDSGQDRQFRLDRIRTATLVDRA